MTNGKQGLKRQSNVYESIQVNLIGPPEDVARLEIPEIAIKELAQSIKEQGLLQPIIVAEKDGRYEIVAGHRRWLAVQYLKHKTISCKVVDNIPIENAMARASENLQRSDLTPLEEGLIYQGLVEKFNMPLDQIANITGISIGVVRRRINILKMPDSLIDPVHKKLISQTVAEELMRCPDEEYREYLIQMARDHGVTALVARQWVDDRLKELRAKDHVGGGAGRSHDVYIETPIYVACQACKKPKEISNLKHVGVCTECFKVFVAMLESGSFKKGGE